LSVRVHGDPETARRALMQRLSAIDPNVGDVVTLRTIAGLATYFLQVAFWLTLVLGALALALTVSGLFSVLSYLVEQRTKEIGVRMALGATAADVGRLVLAQTVRPVGVGMTIGAGVAVALAVALLASPAAATIGALVRVLDPVAYGASLVVIVLACGLAASVPTLKAARIDPMTSLRHE
jgi:ABC-type antimicrobial peptide transport system permease subunit